MAKTWKEYKAEIEDLGITDDTELQWIDVGEEYKIEIDKSGGKIQGVSS